MSELGVFAVDRGIFDHPLFDEKAPFSKREAWLWLLAEAAWKPVRRNVGGRIIELQRGQTAHSIRFMAEAWGWPKSNVARFLDRLKTETMIGTDVETGVLVVTIRKYDEYQRVSLPDRDDERDTDRDSSGTAAGQQRDRLEDIQDIQIDISSSDLPKKPDEIDAALAAYDGTARKLGLPVVRAVSPERRKKLGAVLRRHGLDGWCEALSIVEQTPFLAGESDRGWRASLDFLLQPSSLIKVLERQYGGKTAAEPPRLVEDEARWQNRLAAARERRMWASDTWGPMPGHDGCRVPGHLLRPGDGEGWMPWKDVA